MASLGVGFLGIGFIAYIFYSFCMYKILQKANYKTPIAAFVPIWNGFALVDIVKKKWWWAIILFIPYVNIIALVLVNIRLAKFFGKGDGFTVGLILLGFIFYPILAFGDAQYIPDAQNDER
ncbi:MAG: signal peptidase I [Bacteroidetes bacterium]|nr:signal peptidase I [Bacteroidota bacterium]